METDPPPRVFPYTDPAVTDNGQLEYCPMELQGVIRSRKTVEELVVSGRPIAAHGRRHSQGGQTLLRDALSLDVDRLQDITVNEDKGKDAATVEIEAGASWSQLHQVLNSTQNVSRRFAPLTHQSSPHFSIGGSLAVNCHGRDPRQGPVANGVRALELMVAGGKTFSLSRDRPKDGPLLDAVLGGYGACGLILSVVLDLKHEHNVAMTVSPGMSIEEYANLAKKISKERDSRLVHHYAFLKCAADDSLFTSAYCVVGRVSAAKPRVEQPEPLITENLASVEILSIIYRQYRKSRPEELGRSWETLMSRLAEVDSLKSANHRRELDLMRAPTRFMQALADSHVDLMQELFVPPEKAIAFIGSLRDILIPAQRRGVLMLLTCTARVVQPDRRTLLSYCPQSRLSLVFNFKTPIALGRAFADPSNALTQVMRSVIQLALDLGGSYYPCYGRFASVEQFRGAFDRVWPGKSTSTLQTFVQVRKELDPKSQFNNAFLRHYVGG